MIKDRRQQHRFSQRYVAKACGISVRYWQMIEKGKTTPSEAVCARIVHFFNGIEQHEQLKDWIKKTNPPDFENIRVLMASIVHICTAAQDCSVLNEEGTAIDLDKIYDRALRIMRNTANVH